jgi:hypothetical protein
LKGKSACSTRADGVKQGTDMRTRIAALMLAVVLLALRPADGAGNNPGWVAATATLPPAAIWQKAVEVYRTNRNWYAEKTAILSEVLNRRGEPYSITELYFTTRVDSGGQMFTDLTRALKNGEDVSEKMKTKVEIHHPGDGMDPQKEESLTLSLSDSPFDPERQQRVEFHPAATRLRLFGHTCRRFDFTYRTEIIRKGKTEELTWSGMAWLDEASGVPVKLEFSIAPLPGRIRSLWTIYLYDTARPDRWVVKKVVITGHGGFLFIVKHFRTTSTFSDYRLRPQEAIK